MLIYSSIVRWAVKAFSCEYISPAIDEGCSKLPLPKQLAECRESSGDWMGNVSLDFAMGKSAVLSDNMRILLSILIVIPLLRKWIK